MKTTLLVIMLIFVSLTCNNGIMTKPKAEMCLTIANLTKLIESIPMKFKDIVVAQAILESGWFKSKVCILNKNLFGMKIAKSRETNNIGNAFGYAKYANWKDSVIDYYLLQLTKKDINKMTRDQYFAYLDEHYSSDNGNYSKKLKRIIKCNLL